MELIGQDSAIVAAQKIQNNFSEIVTHELDLAEYLANIGSNLVGILYLSYSVGTRSINIDTIVVLSGKLIKAQNISVPFGKSLYLWENDLTHAPIGTKVLTVASNGNITFDIPLCAPLAIVEISGSAAFETTGTYTITHSNTTFSARGYITLNVTQGQANLCAGREKATEFVIEVTRAPCVLSWSRSGPALYPEALTAFQSS